MEQDNRFLKVTLDDSIIKATDEDGDERVRLSIKVDGHDVLVRFPTYGNWDFYLHDLSQLMIILAQTALDIELNGDKVPDEHFHSWAYVMSQTLQYKECKELVEKIFIEYLRPTVEGVNESEVKDWLKTRMDMSHLFYMFTSIMHIEHWFKKKSLEILQTTFPNLTAPSTKDTSPGNSMYKSRTSEIGMSYEFD